MCNGEFARWRFHSAQARNRLGLPADARPWSGRSKVRFGGFRLTERQQDLVDCAWAHRRASQPNDTTTAELRKSWWCNISQAVQRKPWSSAPPGACRSTLSYSFEADTVVTGFGQMLLLGWPRNFAPSDAFTSNELYQLAGEGFSVPISAIIAHAMYCNPHAEWW